jgi:hypothetical protein
LQTNGSLTKNGGNEYFSVPGHTPVIFSEVGGRTLYRLLARDAGGETEGVLLNETVPRYDQFFRGGGGVVAKQIVKIFLMTKFLKFSWNVLTLYR